MQAKYLLGILPIPYRQEPIAVDWLHMVEIRGFRQSNSYALVTESLLTLIRKPAHTSLAGIEHDVAIFIEGFEDKFHDTLLYQSQTTATILQLYFTEL
jgi:hypothetical protein